MSVVVRKAVAEDAPRWADLLRAVFGEDYPDRSLYDPLWIGAQLQGGGGTETWIAESDEQFQAALSFLAPSSESKNPVANLGRHLNRPESFENGAATALLQKATDLATERDQVLVSRVLASSNQQQLIYEKAGFTCIGFQPYKHLQALRESVLFYYRLGRHDLGNRLPISESLPQVAELAAAVLGNFGLARPATVRDGITGYPLHGEVQFHEGKTDEFELWKMKASSSSPAVEISGAYNQGVGYMRGSNPAEAHALFATRGEEMLAGILYVHDAVDRCVRLVDSFAQDDLSMGPILERIVKRAQDDAAVYAEMDVLATAPRLLKSAEQIGFAPVAYLPGIYSKSGSFADVVKLVKLNVVYALENVSLTAQAKTVVDIIDQNYQDQKMGVAVINLLRGLPFFEGLGDGELRKVARLFTQKLFRPGQQIFAKGEIGNEAYVVMRGQIDILLEPDTTAIAQFGNGQVFGELAFLDGTPRAAIAVATQPSILLVMQRAGFNELVQHEPHLGMVVMRNIALELSDRLRRSNEALASTAVARP